LLAFNDKVAEWCGETIPIRAHSASFFKLNHFFSFGFSVCSGCGGVGGLFGLRPSLRASSLAIR
jgi:hypothetical protein